MKVYRGKRSLFVVAVVALCCCPPGVGNASTSQIPDGIYDLIVGGEKAGIAVVENGRFTRPVKAGSCDLEAAEGVVDGETLRIAISNVCLSKTALDLRSNQGKLKFQDSTSAYLNASISTTDGDKPSLSFAAGVYSAKYFAYSDAYLDTLTEKYNRGDSRVTHDIPSI